LKIQRNNYILPANRNGDPCEIGAVHLKIATPQEKSALLPCIADLLFKHIFVDTWRPSTSFLFSDNDWDSSPSHPSQTTQRRVGVGAEEAGGGTRPARCGLRQRA